MRGIQRLLIIYATGGGLLLLLACAGIALVTLGLAPGLPFLLLLMLIYGWMLWAFLHYRRGRQEEILHLLSTAAESQAPLAPALWAYLNDRPQGPLREFWIAVLLFFVFPGYYWVWHRRRSFDRRVARVAYFLEMGEPLPVALRMVPGVVPREALLAAQVGQHTGRLASCLRSSLPRSSVTLWLELLPRFLYPLLLLLFLNGILAFWMNFLLPRMERIFHEFNAELPEVTQQVTNVAEQLSDMMMLSPLVTLSMLFLTGALIASSTLRWYLPGVASIYRRQVQAHVLQMLAVLLDAGMTVPKALDVLIESECFAPVVCRRLRTARRRVEEGMPLADSLQRSRLVPAGWVSLVQSAERMHNLPWTLTELGDTLAARTARLLRRISQVCSPVLVVAVGVLIGFIVLGMFMPLVDLITRVGE